jgi:hypothetical protein
MTATTRSSPVVSAWTAAHEPVAGVPPWARRVALVVPLLVLPSSIWRIAVGTFHAPLVEGLPPDASGGLPDWMPLGLYVLLLSVASELLAFSAVGLVARWGEVFPRWLPVLRGRAVPTWFAVVPASVGAVVLTVMATWVAVTAPLGLTIQGDRPSVRVLTFESWQGVVAVIAYAPLLAWGPLLGCLTVAYRRRRSSRSFPGRTPSGTTFRASRVR